MMVYLIDSTAPSAPRLTTLAGLQADPGTFSGNWSGGFTNCPATGTPNCWWPSRPRRWPT